MPFIVQKQKACCKILQQHSLEVCTSYVAFSLLVFIFGKIKWNTLTGLSQQDILKHNLVSEGGIHFCPAV